jgi:aspartyl-tRNA synthetase
MEELGDWKRTHYSKEISGKFDSKEVIVMGWVRAIRTQGKITFIKLADREGFSQIILKENETKPNVLKKFEEISRESVIAVKGTVKKNKEAPNKWEIIPIEVKILNLAETPLPLEVETKKTPAELVTRLDSRFLDLRKREVAAIFKVTDTVKSAFLEFFGKQGFVDINTPVIVAAATEGGAELFPLKYFEREAFLSQSPQLYKQILMSTGFDKVVIVTPVFRAEPHDTYRHLNESMQMDIEVAFVRNEEDALEYFDKFLPYAIEKIKKKNKTDLKFLGTEIKEVKAPIKRITYEEALEVLNKKGIKIKFGEDLTPEAERKLCEEFNPVIVTKWPFIVRSFYCMKEGEKLCKGYDLLYNGIEIASGAQREHRYDNLVGNMKAKNLNPKSFEFYLNAFRYGMPPHAGWSIGLERFVMTLLNLQNIREARLFPRTRERIHP